MEFQQKNSLDYLPSPIHASNLSKFMDLLLNFWIQRNNFYGGEDHFSCQISSIVRCICFCFVGRWLGDEILMREKDHSIDPSLAYPTIWIKKCSNFEMKRDLFLKKWPIPSSLFIYFRLLKTVPNTVDSKKNLPTTGFEPRIFGVGNDHSTNWATTTANETTFLGCCRRIRGT